MLFDLVNHDFGPLKMFFRIAPSNASGEDFVLGAIVRWEKSIFESLIEKFLDALKIFWVIVA